MTSLNRTRHYSIMGERPGRVDVKIGDFFSAIETQSMKQLQKCMQKEPEKINGHGGPFFITPLHFAAEVGWLEGARELLAREASVCARNQYGQTPLHYAATAKHEPITALMLTSTTSFKALNLRDMRGMSPLHEAAASGCLPVVKILLEHDAVVTCLDNQGESPLHKAAKAGAFSVMVALMEAGADLQEKDLRGMCAMRWLIFSADNGLQRLLDHLLITSGSSSCRPPVTFNFLPLVKSSGTQECRLLSYFIQTDNRDILAHPVCQVFILIKWRRMKPIFLGYLLYFMIYAILTNLFIFRRQLVKENDEERTINATHIADKDPTTQPDSVAIHVIHGLLCVMTLLLFMSQINRLRTQGWRVCVWDSNFWLQLSSVVCVTSLLVLYWCRGLPRKEDMEDNIATIQLLFLQLHFLFILKKYPSYGLYVVMFMKVAKEFLKLFVVYCTLLLTFTSTMFLTFNSNGSENTVHSRWPMLFLKSITMMVGSVEITDSLVEQHNSNPITAGALFFFSVVFISIVLANLLVALAVSDIRELRASAHLTRFASIVEALQNIEQSCDFPFLWRLGNYCRLHTAATHVRMWPKHNSPHPCITVELRKQHQHRAQQRYGWSTWLVERLHPREFQENISVTLHDEVLARITARETIALDPDQLDVPHDYKVFFDEILKRLRLLEVSRIH
ncbi:Transient receptor potential channel pyrexia [Portunus trituberculatus]|uniref:Transient receptor potential channel pyrexia n=2 Tax=Portunus trituberculatus TaxID=210409 RepID=A0A5B7G5I1_PORTR|nr:Transient receptor potential channel pyrexia [Portunus trituberculatus]